MAKYNKSSKNQTSPRKPQPGMALPESPVGESRFKAPPLLPGESVDLKREAFNRKQFDDTVNTNFTELGVSTIDEATFDPSLANVGDFFTIYQTLFFQIPKEGDVNSHLFLVKESTEYLQYVAQQEEIAALLEEITELRQQNLTLVADIANITAGFETTISELQDNIG